MDRMVIDAALAAKFQQLDGPTELVDAAGYVVAVVSPQYDPALYAPPRYRRACGYDAFVPNLLDTLPAIAPEVAGTISAAEDAIRQLVVPLSGELFGE